MKADSIKKYRRFIPAVLAGAVLISAVVLFFGNRENRFSKTYTEEEVKLLCEEHTYVIKENGITYVFYPDGTLLVSGTGATKSFATIEEAKQWYLTELYHAVSGWYPEGTERLMPFRLMLDKVTRIEIEEGVTALGDSTFSPFYYVETVTAPTTMKKVGSYAFLGTGQSTGTELKLYGFEAKEMEYDETSFIVFPTDILTETATGSALRISKVPVRPEAERGTVPEEDLLVAKVQMGEDIEYRLYENGVLYVTGTGTTYDFDRDFEMERHIMDMFNYTSRMETETLWFDMVTEILIEDSVERIGDNALAQYKYVSSVYGETLTELGSRAFFRLGRHVEEISWNVNLTDAAVQEDTFLYCKTIPDITGETD